MAEIFWELEHARTVLEFYRDYLPTAPRRLCPFLGVKRIPGGPPFPEALWGRPVCAIIGCYDGPASDGARAVDVIRKRSRIGPYVHVEHAARLPPGPSIMHLYPVDGAVHDVPSDATALGCRDARWSMVIAGITLVLEESAAVTQRAKDYFAALHP